MKSPLPLRKIIVFGSFNSVAVVELLDTFPTVDIVASLVSTIPAVADISIFTISLSSILAEVTTPAPIVVTPVLEIETSPIISASEAKFELSPIQIFPSVNADPTGDVPVIIVFAAAISLPLLSTVNVGT